MEPWQTIPLADAPRALYRYDGLNARLARMGDPTDAELVDGLRAAGVGRYCDPSVLTVRNAVSGAAGVGSEPLRQGMTALVEAITGERVSIRRRLELSEADIREDLARWVDDRRADLEEGEDPCCLDAAAALAERPPVFLVAMVVTRIQDEIRSSVTDYIGELADGDGADLGRQAARIAETAWREAAAAWVASRA